MMLKYTEDSLKTNVEECGKKRILPGVSETSLGQSNPRMSYQDRFSTETAFLGAINRFQSGVIMRHRSLHVYVNNIIICFTYKTDGQSAVHNRKYSMENTPPTSGQAWK